MRIPTIGLMLAWTICLAAVSRAADQPLVLDVWPGKVPGETGAVGVADVNADMPDPTETNAHAIPPTLKSRVYTPCPRTATINKRGNLSITLPSQRRG